MRRSVFIMHTMIVFAGISSVFSLSKSQTDQLYINEVLASNVDFNLSPQYNEYSDWIELFNSSSSSISLSGFYLSDDPGNVTKWEIPEGIIIEADGYLLFWADGRNSSNHTGFELDKNGEFIGLYNAEGTLIDSVSFGIHRDDTAYGRLTSDPDTWVYFGNPTPGTGNAGPVFDGIATGLQFSIPGGFYSGSQVVSLTCSTPSSEIYYTIDGTEPNGNGPTLSLINYNLNNDLPEDWGSSVEIGTPGAKNVIDGIIAMPENITQNDKRDILYQNYPNPADQSTYINIHWQKMEK
jgi:hypothetical protein